MEPAAASKQGTATKASGRETPTVQLRLSWDRQLDAYTSAQSGGTPSAVRSLRAKLVEGVKASNESPEAWWALLQQEEALASNNTATLDRGAARGGVTLFDLYHSATKVIPRQNNYNNDAFIRIWLGYARQQWIRNQDDARDVFKMLKSQHIGDQHAALYYEWAALEAAAGHLAKAMSVLSKGMKEQAQPACLLEQMQSDLQAGKFVYKAPWVQEGSKTGHSGASSLAAFLTPGVLDERRSTATPTLEMTGNGTGATDTLVINRSSLRQGSAVPACPTDSGRPGSALGTTAAGGDTETVVLGGAGRGGMAAPAVSQQQQQHTAGLTEQLNNRTSHTMHSGSTVGSDDPTATMRMKTPGSGAAGGAASGGSTGSLGEEATVSLRKPGRMSGGDAGADANRPGNEDTLVINRSSLLKNALSSAGPKEGSSAAAASCGKEQCLLKPRRLGVLGKAQRVVPGAAAAKPPLAPAAQAEQQQASDEVAAAEASRKRKAEMEAAQSPNPPLKVGEGKRRQSPGEEVKAGRTAQPAAAAVAGASRHGERQLPPVPRFDEQRPAPAAAPAAPAAVGSTRTTAADMVTTAAPSRQPLASLSMPPPSRPQQAASTSQAAAAVPPARQQVVLREGGAVARPAGGQDVGGDEDETAPVVMTKLAQRVQRGRQSLAPSKIVLDGDGSLLHHSGPGASTAADDDDAPTVLVPHPAPAAAGQGADEDADATRPLQRPAGPSKPAPVPQARPAGPRVQIDSSGNVDVVRPSSAGSKPLPVPPPPPPSLAEAGVGLMAAPQPAQPRVPMGPPPPKQIRPAAAPVAQQAPAARPGRRVVEDENTVTVKDIQYTKLECVGRGGSSKVYKVMAPNRKIFALKRIRLQGRDAEAASGFLDEIRLLNSLAGKSNIIQLIDSEVHRSEGLIYMVLEFGDVDLARLLQKHEKLWREKAGDEEVDENFIRLYWEQMLMAVDTIHRERIVHSDLKPANFLMVEGQLKLIDFGIAKAIQSDTTSIARESQVGTLNYMSPEAILGGQNNIRGGPPMKVGRASDIWSLGCILYQMVYGHTPFSHLPFIQKMHAIIDPNHRISFPPLRNHQLLDVIQRCLDRNPRSRISMQELLEHPFLRPTHAPAAAATPKASGASGSVELSRDQLTKLLQQVAQAGVAGSDVGQLSEQLFKQLANGLSPDLVSRKVSASAAAAAEARSSAAVPPPPLPPSSSSMPPPARPVPVQPQAHQQQQQQQQPTSVAGAAAQAAAARASQRAEAVAALENRPRAAANTSSGAAAAGGSGRAALMPISQSAILQQAAALRKVEPAQKQPAAKRAETGLEAALRKGLERFRFEDATGGEDGGNTTGGFGDI